MRTNDHANKPCPVARASAEVGDVWTLLILRNAMLGARQFEDFQRQLGLTRHVLAKRLKNLVELDILKRVPVRPGAARMAYQLTKKGLDFQPVILALASWANTWLFDDDALPLTYRHTECGHDSTPTVCCSECGGEMNAFNTAMQMHGAVVAAVQGSEHPEQADQLGYPVQSIERTG